MNMLLNDVLPTDVSVNLLSASKDSILQGFQWACREGPLCEESIRGVKFKLLDARLAEKAELRGGGQLIPASRKCSYAAFLTATPRLMEPLLFAEIRWGSFLGVCRGGGCSGRCRRSSCSGRL